MKDYHSQRHHNDTARNYASVSWYIDRVAFFNRGRISEKSTAKVHDTRKYQNSLVHSLPVAQTLDFEQSLFDLSKFAAKLPEV